jgi:uncharacterized protein
MKLRSSRILAASIAFAAAVMAALPAAAAQSVQDGAGMFSASTVAQLNERLSAFNAQTGKEIVVVTTPSLNGATLQSAADSAFNQQSVNGVLIYIARNDRRDMIVPDRAGVQAGWFTSDVLAQIRTAMEGQFKGEDYDAGITGAVNSLLQIYRAHLGSLQQSRSGVVTQGQRVTQGVHISMFWWIIILVVGFLILRTVMRAATASRYYGNAPPPGGAPPGAGYGPGYGQGYGYGGFGGGGSFWSGLLGGLGGAWLGNELFRGGGGIGGAGGIVPSDGGGVAPDAGGWQSDAGQAGAGSGGDWSGGGFGSDFGGGGDVGGGGGDSGGGW